MPCKKKDWGYKKAIIKSNYGKLYPRVELRHPTERMVWLYVQDAWNERVVKGALPNDCWDWKGSWHRQGLPMINVRRENDVAKHGLMNAQRLSKAIDIGRALTADERVYSVCHNNACTNPLHLEIGDRSDTILNSPIFKDRHKWEPEFIRKHMELLTTEPRGKVAKALNVSVNQAMGLKVLAKKQGVVDEYLRKFGKI